MTIEPEELSPIIDAYGGIEAFAELIGSRPRTVYSWLSRERSMTGPTAKLIRSLPKAKKIAHSAK